MSRIKEFVEGHMERSGFVKDVFGVVAGVGSPYEKTLKICMAVDPLLRAQSHFFARHDVREAPAEGRKLAVYGKKGGVYIAEYRKGADGVGRFWTHGKVIEPVEWRYL